jgi:hypothetical protein
LGGKRGRRARNADVDDPRLPQDRRFWGRGRRASGSEHDHRLRVRGELGPDRLSAFGVARIVLGVELQRVVQELAAALLEGDLDGPFLIEPGCRIGT